MAEELFIKVNSKKARKVIDELIEKKLITVQNSAMKNLTPKKKKQAKDFLKALQEAKLAEQGKIKLKTLDELINEL